MAFIAESDRHQSGRGECHSQGSDRQQNGRGIWHQSGRGIWHSPEGFMSPGPANAIAPTEAIAQCPLVYAIWPSAQERNPWANAICPPREAPPTPLQNTNVLAIALIQTELTE